MADNETTSRENSVPLSRHDVPSVGRQRGDTVRAASFTGRWDHVLPGGDDDELSAMDSAPLRQDHELSVGGQKTKHHQR